MNNILKITGTVLVFTAIFFGAGILDIWGGNVVMASDLTCSMVATPSNIDQGGSTTLNWGSSGASSAYINNGIGSVGTSGSRVVSPTQTTTYTGTFYCNVGCMVEEVICSTTVVVNPPVITPTCTVNISPVNITKGGSATVYWSANHATSGSITNIGTVSASGGTRVISPNITTTYTGTFTGPGGTAVCSGTINVYDPVVYPAPTCSMNVAPFNINQGGSSTISWTATDASSAVITGIGTVSASGGSRIVIPNSTTTYTGTFVGPGGSVTCSKTVSVTPVVSPPSAPTCSMSASPSSIEKGESSTISWSATNATSASITNIGTVSFVGGSRVVSPDTTTTYTGTFIGAGGSVTCSKTINVSPTITPPPTPTCGMSAIPSIISQGESATISWTSDGANSASIDQGIGNVSLDGSLVVSPTQTTTYTGTFAISNICVSCQTTCSATVIVEGTPPPAPTCEMSADPTSINSGDSSTLTWTTTNVASASIDNGIGSVNVNDSEIVFPTSNTNYIGTFLGTNGDTIYCDASVTVEGTPPPAPTCEMNADPTLINSGDSSTLTWTTTNVASASIDNGIGSVNVNDSEIVFPTSNTNYIGTFLGTNGDTITCDATITLEGTPPPAPTCEMSADPTSINSGDSSTLTWTTTNVASASIDNGIGSVNVNDSEIVFPTSNTNYIGTFLGTNGDTIYCDASITIEGTPPPSPSCSMSFNPSHLGSINGSSTLTWTSNNVTSAVIDNEVGDVELNDSMVVGPPITATTYTGTFTGPYGSVVCRASLSFGGGGNNPPSVSLSSKLFPGDDPEPSYIYLNQVPYTGFLGKILNGVKFIMVAVPNFIMVNI